MAGPWELIGTFTKDMATGDLRLAGRDFLVQQGRAGKAFSKPGRVGGLMTSYGCCALHQDCSTHRIKLTEDAEGRCKAFGRGPHTESLALVRRNAAEPVTIEQREAVHRVFSQRGSAAGHVQPRQMQEQFSRELEGDLPPGRYLQNAVASRRRRARGVAGIGRALPLERLRERLHRHQWPPLDVTTGDINDWPEDESRLYCLESSVTETSALAVLCMPGYPLRAAQVIENSGENALNVLAEYFDYMTRIVGQGYYLGTSSMKFAKHQGSRWVGVSFPLIQILAASEDADHDKAL